MGNIKNAIQKLDYSILLIVFILTSVGIYSVWQADRFSEKLSGLATKQILGAGIGLVAIIVIAFMDYHFICNLSPVFYLGMLVVLTLTLFAPEKNGVRRWINIGPIQFQPSELTKIVLILFLAYLCHLLREKMDQFYTVIILAAAVALPVVLILKEPHLSSCIVILIISGIIVYASKLDYKVMGLALIIGISLLAGIIISVGVFHVKLPFIKEYQIKRLMSFQSDDESEDLEGKYQQNQAKVAIAAGGSSGKLLSGEASDKKFDGIYAYECDFVFSIVGEEFGFIGSCIIISLYLILVIKCLIIAAHAPDEMGKLICIGVATLLMFQTFVNVGVATSLLPNTGLPLPFISYGLSSLVSYLAAVGLVLNVGLRQTNRRH